MQESEYGVKDGPRLVLSEMIHSIDHEIIHHLSKNPASTAQQLLPVFLCYHLGLS